MKGKISIKDFIKSVKEEILESIDEENPLFELTNIDLEIAFQLEANAGAGFKLYVFEANAGTTATQIHKVTISLSPFIEHKKVTKSPNIKQALIDTGRANNGTRVRTQKTIPATSRPVVMKKNTGKITVRRPTVKKDSGRDF